MAICNDFPVGNQLIALLENESKEKAIPLSGTFELTPRCNFNCKMCYVHLENDKISNFGKELSADEWIDIARQAKDMGMLQLCITGGEPILHPEFKKIYKELSEMGFFIILQTNLSTITEDILELIEIYPPEMVKFSIYGSNDDVYREVCGIEKGFTRVEKGINDLQKLGIQLVAVTTIIKQNKEDLENIGRFCQSKNVPWIYTASVKPSVRGAETNAEEVALNEFEVTDFRADVSDWIDNPMIVNGKKPCDHCRGYRNSFWVMWNGKVQFCSFMNEPDISIRDNTFKEAWDKLIAYEEGLRWPEECYKCEIFKICRKCAGMFAAFTGSATKVDKDYCNKIKKYVKEELERRNNEI